MTKTSLAAGLLGALLLASCSSRPPSSSSSSSTPAAQQPATPSAATLQPAPSPAPVIPPLTIEGYKKSVAERIVRASPDVFSEPMPEMFKSIVVLDITIDRDGRLSNVAVRRSNGFKALENKAMESVRRAGPFGAPAFTVRRGDGTVSFLETFMFRDDGRFRIRSLVE
ncbi:MAG: TonB family protein [Candidatus Parcubacteria bacterium]|nr:TonB family protein [Burkholderiales bacterium]